MGKNLRPLDKVYLSPTMAGIESYIKIYKNYHSRWIHTSWLLLEDLNRPVTYEDVDYTIFGMWDNENSEVIIMLKPVTRGAFRLLNSKKVAIALGYNRMRNLLTGEVRPYGVEDVAVKNSGVLVETYSDDDIEDEDFDDTEETENDIVYQELIDDIIDSGDSAAY